MHKKRKNKKAKEIKMEQNAYEGVKMPVIGDTAPSFEADTTQGRIKFPEDYKGKWVILFSHPADFTPVCTTEFMTFASMEKEFDKLNCKLIGLSIDSHYSHIAWLRTIKEKIEYRGMKSVEVNFPVIADLTMDVAKKFGMVQPNASTNSAVRAVFFIDPRTKVRALMYYPSSTGRNFQEIKRVLICMQTADEHNVATPADWQPGEDVIVPPPGSCGSAKERVDKSKQAGVKCLDWFICFKSLRIGAPAKKRSRKPAMAGRK
jgi:peroxiredoxin (alkyl hydroperoxide reductase subunit C)